jgi:hypothetical protein
MRPSDSRLFAPYGMQVYRKADDNSPARRRAMNGEAAGQRLQTEGRVSEGPRQTDASFVVDHLQGQIEGLWRGTGSGQGGRGRR